ncbi:MAG: UDP-N-acetylmuramate--L-alanine ligase [Spirochaetales bacterium]|nr:UDP-N-acetylmuramate--L-alanine ligase [Spirochaetales bacterium]
MSRPALPAELNGLRIHLVGAKGTGMAAFAEILSSRGAILSGSDVPEVFFTDEILARIGLRCREFAAANVRPDHELVIHSSAYRRDSHPELVEADRLGLPVLLYTEALGDFSGQRDSSGVAGVHGKTTTTALAGVAAEALGLPATILAGSVVGSFGDRATLIRGERYFIAETCEYRRHFLSFSPRRIVLTSVESDHQDYYPTYGSIRDAFVEYALSLPAGGALVYCADDPGAVEVAALAAAERSDLVLVPYGFTAEGPWRIEGYCVADERAFFSLAAFDGEFALRVPGRHLALDACAAVALAALVRADLDCLPAAEAPAAARPLLPALRPALESFSGSRRRSEFLGEAGGVVFMDDYAHHPTAIRTTLRGLKEFYPARRLVVDFMSHTYSRTKALLDEFAESLADADEVWLHRIYASARETPDGDVDGRTLFGRTAAIRSNVNYVDEPLEAVDPIAASLKPGDLFITMGAGDNFVVGRRIFERFKAREGGKA